VSSLPEPLTPTESDLRGFDNLQLDVDLLPKSKLANYAEAEAFRAAVLLWCEAWKQVPAASLPDDDLELRAICGLQRDAATWERIKKDALHKFIKCSDGRLYHKVLAEKANKAWESRLRYRALGKAGAEARAKAYAKPDGTPEAQQSESEGEERRLKEKVNPEDSSQEKITTSPRARQDFDVLKYLGGEEIVAAKARAPGWDVYYLAGLYNDAIADGKLDPPRLPRRAFPAWCGKFTKGRAPPGKGSGNYDA
jgi:hypothetical protein